MLRFDKRNFGVRELVRLWELTDAADVIALDCEFNCVRFDDKKWGARLSHENAYKAYKEVVEKGCLLELGMTFVTKDSQENIKAVVCSFTLFKGDSEGNNLFTSDKECIEFLASHGFDFNACFMHGLAGRYPQERKISFFTALNLLVSEEQKSALSPFSKKNYKSTAVSPHENKFCEELIRFKDDPDSSALGISWPVSDRPTLGLWMNSEFIDLLPATEFTVEQLGETIIITKHKSDREKALEDLFRKHGVALLLWSFALKRKRLVFHHGLLDYMYIFSNFISRLPESLDEFKAWGKCLGWRVSDTKLIAHRNSAKLAIRSDNDLSRLYTHWYRHSSQVKKVQIVTYRHFNDLKNSLGHFVDLDAKDLQTHNAGSDSYMTAMAYFAMSGRVPDSIQAYDGHFWHKFDWKNSSFSVLAQKSRTSIFSLTLSGEEEFSQVLQILRQIGDFDVKKTKTNSFLLSYHWCADHFASHLEEISRISSAKLVFLEPKVCLDQP